MSNAAPYTTTAKSGLPVRNNGGIVPRGGAITTGSPITSAPDNLTQGYTSRGVGGTTVLSKTGANIGTLAAVSANAFARTMAPGQFVMFRYGFVAGSSSSFLNSGAGDYGRQSIHGKTTRRSYHITSWSFAINGGKLTVNKGADTNDSFGTDDAAAPTRAIPGELVYSDHGLARSGALAVPIDDFYKAKTG